MSRKVCVEIEEELYQRLETLPWGTRTPALRHMMELICTGVEKHGDIFLGALLSRNLRLTPKEEQHEQVG